MRRLVSILEFGRDDFLEATRGVSSSEALARRSFGGWTILECAEHLVIAEDRYLTWLSEALEAPYRHDFDRELRLFSIMRSRLTKVESPDVFLPQGRFRTLADALAEFEAVRMRIIEQAEQRVDRLHSIVAEHPYFGPINGAELIQLVDGHARRHADQIREIREALA